MEMTTKANLIPMGCSQLASKLEDSTAQLLLVDTRPSPQHCNKHIKNSENINFSNILLRRLLKGVVQISTMISWSLAQKMASRDSEQVTLIVYDSSSKRDSVKADLHKHAELLAETELRKDSDSTVYFLDGGFDTMSEEYPHLCASSGKKTHSPLGISVSASLPLFDLPGQSKKYAKLQTPSEDTSSQFGPPIEILPHLILGCAKDSSNLAALRKRGVTAMLNVSHNCPNHFESLLEYKSIPVQDSYQADLLSRMDAAIEYINSIRDKNGCVFVHCHAGISRSATICIAYIMKTMQCDLSKAYDFVKQKRSCISPNLHFMGQLLEFEKQLQKEKESCTDYDMADSNIDTPLASGGCGLYFGVSIHTLAEEEEEYTCTHPSSPLPSASAPSSLNFETENDSKDSKLEPKKLLESIQVLAETRCHRKLAKPRTLPLKQPIPQPVQTATSTASTPPCASSKPVSLRKSNSPPLNSTSLPTTPLAHQYSSNRNSPLATLLSSPLSQLHELPHTLSPCRMVAQLGSMSDSCLIQHLPHTPLAESM